MNRANRNAILSSYGSAAARAAAAAAREWICATMDTPPQDWRKLPDIRCVRQAWETLRIGQSVFDVNTDRPWKWSAVPDRPDNAIALSIVAPGAGKVSCTLKPEQVGESRIGSTRKVEAGWATYHNVYQYGKGGFDVAIRVVAKGGKTGRDDESIRVEGADSVLVLMRIAPWKIPAEGSDAWAYNPKHPDVAADKLGVYVPAPAGADSSVTAYLAADDAKALLEKVTAALAELPADYDRLIEKHAKVHRALFDRVTLGLGGGADRQRTSEQLLDIAQKDKRLPPALLEKMFDAGRYMVSFRQT
jgi:alpha-L-fucosidase 2